MNLLLLFDGNNFCLRNMGGSSFRTAEGSVLKTSTGVETGMLLGAIQSFVSLCNRFKPSHVAFCFDQGRSSFRLGIRSSYKSNRGPASDPVNMYSLTDQFGYFKDFLNVLNVPYLQHPGVEADDFIAAVVSDLNMESVIVSSDHDLLQLVSNKVSVLKGSTGQTKETVFTPDEVMKKYDLPVHQLSSMWAIMGDSGDGINGIPKVGPVTATKMLKTYGNLTTVLAKEPKTNGFEKLVSENYRMINLDGAPALPYIPKELKTEFNPCHSDELREYLVSFEMFSLVRKLDQKTLWN